MRKRVLEETKTESNLYSIHTGCHTILTRCWYDKKERIGIEICESPFLVPTLKYTHIYYKKCNFRLTPYVRLLVGRSVGCSVGRSVGCHYIGQFVTLEFGLI